MALFKIRFHAVDNNGKRGTVQLYHRSEDYTSAEAYAFALVTALQAVSSASFVEFDIRLIVEMPAPVPPSPDSDADTYALLFYRNDNRVGTISVPSPGKLPTEATGPYAGVRYTRGGLDLSGMLGPVEDIPEGLVDGLGRPYPTTFSVGGRVRV